MPIFTKDSKQIYFAHIPKTAGTTIYMLFAENGWLIKNLAMNAGPDTSFELLKKNYGIQAIESTDKVYRWNNSIQHAPFFTWRRWGPFDQEFAIFRQPVSRFVSAVIYQNRHEYLSKDMLEDCIHKTIAKLLSASSNIKELYDGHFLPQHRFISPKTYLFRYCGDVVPGIQSHFGLSRRPSFNANVSTIDFKVSSETKDKIKKLYRRDTLIWRRLKNASPCQARGILGIEHEITGMRKVD